LARVPLAAEGKQLAAHVGCLLESILFILP
jgi:hypothetical protein